MTVLLQSEGNESVAEQVVLSSRTNYAIKVSENKTDLQAKEAVISMPNTAKRRRQVKPLAFPVKIEQPIG